MGPIKDSQRQAHFTILRLESDEDQALSVHEKAVTPIRHF